MKSLINIIALILLCTGAIYLFYEREIFKEKTSSKWKTTSGFVVCILSLIIIYIVNR